MREQASTPAKALQGRSVVVVLGASPAALSLLSRTLQALGVDMLERAGDENGWGRPWVGALNARLLAAAERPMEHPAHALPFPPAWWRRPEAQAIGREMVEALQAALADQAESWGFADVATARLLPVWQDVFERLGVEPVYLWALTRPTAGEDHESSPAASEVRWFAYGADIYRYAGQHLSGVIDEADWSRDPQGLMERLVRLLRLRWRGTRQDLYETVAQLLAQGRTETVALSRPASLPVSMQFYESAARLEEDEQARARLQEMVDSAELLRPLITPFLPVLQGGEAGAPAEQEAQSLRQEVAALRETCAGLRRQVQATALPPPAAATAGVGELQVELQARILETRWLHDQYAARLGAAQAEIERLRADRAAGPHEAAEPSAAADEELASALAEVARLQAELTVQTNANERYLARIYELKHKLGEGRPNQEAQG